MDSVPLTWAGVVTQQPQVLAVLVFSLQRIVRLGHLGRGYSMVVMTARTRLEGAGRDHAFQAADRGRCGGTAGRWRGGGCPTLGRAEAGLLHPGAHLRVTRVPASTPPVTLEARHVHTAPSPPLSSWVTPPVPLDSAALPGSGQFWP